MADIVICDTNAVIQLVIICSQCFKVKSDSINFVVHSLVRQEIHQLRKDVDKEQRLGDIFDFIQKKIPTRTTVHLPGRQKEQQFDNMIRRVEQGLPPNMISAGSSPNDRKFLILAKTNNAHLLTNERTLYNLGKALLKNQETWRVSDALERIVSSGLVSKKEVQNGINNLYKYKEFLSSECSAKLKKLGYENC